MNSIETAPKDGTKIEVRIEDHFPLEAYWGGGADKAWREWHSCRMIQEPIIGWRNIEVPEPREVDDA